MHHNHLLADDVNAPHQVPFSPHIFLSAGMNRPPSNTAMDVLGSYKKKRGSRAWSARQEVSQDAQSVLEHAAKHDIQSRAATTMRSTGIICTIVNYASVEQLTQLRVAGMNIMRLNFSHGTHAEPPLGANLRQSVTAEPLDGRIVGIALDTKGPEIRTGLVRMAALPENTVAPMLDARQVVTIPPPTGDQCSKELIFVDYPRLPQLMKRGQAIYIDDGLIKLTVKAVDRIKGELTCDVMNTTAGRLGSRKKVNVDCREH